MTEEILRNKKNLTGLILGLACEEIGSVEDAVQYLRNRLYTDDDIFGIFEGLLRKQGKIKTALSGGD